MRISVNGNPHWVEGHDVSPNAWERSRRTNVGNFRDLLGRRRAGTSVSATYVIPNAELPVCGAPVFFYQNENGSRVFFDELGPPWPKHPCTDNAAHAKDRDSLSPKVIDPTVRQDEDISLIQQWLAQSEMDPHEDFISKYDLGYCTPYRVEGHFKRRRDSILALRGLANRIMSKRLFLRVSGLPRHVRVDDVIFHHRRWIIYFDRDINGPVDLEAKRLYGASEFVDAVLAMSRPDRKANESDT